MNTKKALIFIFFVSAFLFNSFALEIPERPEGYVNDYANILSQEAKIKLDSYIATLSASTTSEIAVVIVPDMSGDYIENYANELFRKWGIGTKENNNGVLFLLSLEERKSRIEVGYGLEGALTDLESGQILENIKPYLRNNDYDTAVSLGVEEIGQSIQGELFVENKNENKSTWSPEVIINFAFVFFFFVIPWAAAILGRTKSWWLGGVIGLVLAVILFFVLIQSIWIFLLAIFGFIFDYIVSKNYKESVSRGNDPHWWSGGSWGPGSGGYSSSSGGFGGFGGGSSGGGGSSSSW